MATEVLKPSQATDFSETEQWLPMSSSSPTKSRPLKTYNVFYTTSRLNATLHLGSSSSPTTYYAETKLLTTHPSILLRAGASKSSPLIASAKLAYTDRNILLGITDPSTPVTTPEALHWEVMGRNRNRLFRGDYAFETSAGSSVPGEKKGFHWGVDGENLARYFTTQYKCYDEEGKVVASMRSGGMYNLKKGAEVTVEEGLENGLEQILVASALGIWAAEAGWSVFQGYQSSGSHDKAN